METYKIAYRRMLQIINNDRSTLGEKKEARRMLVKLTIYLKDKRTGKLIDLSIQ